MTKVISLLGGPCAGKSTNAPYIFALLKSRGCRAELVTEYIKNWAYEGRKISAYDQFYILGKQIRKESFLLDKVDYIVTDSPVWLCAYYAEEISPPLVKHGVEAAVQGYYHQTQTDGHEHIFVWVNRTEQYDSRDRYHSEEEALEIDKNLKPFLESRGVKLLEITSSLDFKDATKFVEELLNG